MDTLYFFCDWNGGRKPLSVVYSDLGTPVSFSEAALLEYHRQHELPPAIIGKIDMSGVDFGSFPNATNVQSSPQPDTVFYLDKRCIFLNLRDTNATLHKQMMLYAEAEQRPDSYRLAVRHGMVSLSTKQEGRFTMPIWGYEDELRVHASRVSIGADAKPHVLPEHFAQYTMHSRDLGRSLLRRAEKGAFMLPRELLGDITYMLDLWFTEDTVNGCVMVVGRDGCTADGSPVKEPELYVIEYGSVGSSKLPLRLRSDERKVRVRRR